MENGFLKQTSDYATRAIHVGQEPEQWNSYAVVPPITLSTTFKQTSPAEPKQYDYGRSGNPTRDVLEKCIASLDEGKYGFCFASGLGATTTIMSLLNTNDHVICGDDVYGGTNRLFNKVINRQGIEITLIDTTDEKNIEKAIKKNTKMVFVETPTNPLFKVMDIQKISEITKKHNLILVVDNTFLTSYFQRPLNLGADIVLYSLTKYMNGHSDVIMGAVVTNDEVLQERIRFLQNAMGIVPSPFDCALVNRSLKTLAVRMKEHMKSGLAVGRFLEAHAAVERVLHPALPSHPQYEITKKQCYGHSGMLSFYLKGGLEQSKLFLNSLKIFTLAESLGGFESLAELPSVMTHASVPEDQRAKLGITDNLIRISVGLEDVNDLIQDLDNALKIAVAK